MKYLWVKWVDGTVGGFKISDKEAFRLNNKQFNFNSLNFTVICIDDYKLKLRTSHIAAIKVCERMPKKTSHKNPLNTDLYYENPLS